MVNEMETQRLAIIKTNNKTILPGRPVTVPEDGLNPLDLAEALK